MKEKKKIDRLFQESFKDFEAAPKNHVWKNIEQELQKKKDKKVIPFWWYKAAGVAAVLAIIFLAANFILPTNNNTKVVNTKENTTISPKNIKKADKPFTNTENNPIDGINTNKSYVNEENTTTPIIKNNTLNSEKNTPSITNNNAKSLVSSDKKPALKANSTSTGKLVSSPKNSSISTSESLNHTNKKSSSATKLAVNKKQNEEINTSNTNKSLVAESVNKKEKIFGKNNQISTEENKNNSTSSKDNSAIVSVEKNNSEEKLNSEEILEEELNQKKSLVEEAKKIEEEKLNKNDDDNEETNLSKWLIKPNVSPIYYSSLNGGNNIDKSLASNSSESNITMAYGVNFAYAISEKFKVRSGVSKVNMSYNVNNIAYSAGVNSIQLEGITTTPSNETIEIISLDNSSPKPTTISSGEFDRSTNSSFTEGALNQQLGYLEVPVEIEYALIDKRFGVNIIGGASTLFLNDNDVYINSQDSHLSLGEANNLNKVSFTTNVGLGFDYSLSKSFDLNLEPTFKYQLNTYNNNINNFKPYFFGVYTGFSFKF
ncbi:hypothetical protein SAMN04488096_10523 [Mesonia phycicola]|uniref:Outer membrane protein beta-barrel domain-containing protein n=1 Tax=Mesonia phycicola TaxID=579105 RepID=A0A1M6ECW1_9FLAO|nr:hypothetical protein [Mesonia phycicola]SHI83263.1 hypothetical protein SAMN04488096_10523 [Mesonia phycicola]